MEYTPRMSEFAISAQTARAAVERMNMREVAIAPAYAGLMADLQQLAKTDPAEGQASFMARRGDLCAAYGFESKTQDKPFAFAAGLAIIPVSGSLINRFGGSWGSVTGYNFIRSQMNMAAADPDVRAIVFDLNSYGGEAAGCFELAAEIAALDKPTLGVIDSNCYSACYALGSAMNQLVSTPSGGAGSIGVVAMHVDMSKMLADAGFVVTFVHSGEHKVDGNPYMPLPESVRNDMKAGIDKSRLTFATLVADNRGLPLQAVLDTEARTYRADDALRLGLIDAIATPSEAVRAFFAELSGSTSIPSTGASAMTTKTEVPGGAADTAAAQQAAATAAADARTAERARIKGIQTCEASKGREDLANHLALSTDLSVEAAQAILSAAPVAAKAAPAQDTQATASFAQAMAGTQNPNIGADAAAAAAGGSEPSAAQRILSAQRAATGQSAK